jgi:hypothetical protein
MYNLEEEGSFLKAVDSLNDNLNALSKKSSDYALNHSWKAATQDLLKNYLGI